jgi:protoheme IX farnesyltransferase
MSTTAVAVERRRATALARLADYAALAKPRIGVMVLLAVAAAGFVAAWGRPDWSLLVHALVGTGLVVAGSSALNQWLERRSDARMARTAERPLAAGRVGAGEVVLLGLAASAAGFAYLAALVNWPTVIAALAAWVVYVWVYTPLKPRSPLNTPVGAVAGAVPVVIGWLAVGGTLDLRIGTLFLALFLWQFPHFMAIAWLYRRQYAAAGLKMLSVVEPTGRHAGTQAVLAALALLPVSLAPAVLSPPSAVYLVGVFLLGAGQLACAILFFIRLDETSARRLLTASLVYLPALLAMWMYVSAV